MALISVFDVLGPNMIILVRICACEFQIQLSLDLGSDLPGCPNLTSCQLVFIGSPSSQTPPLILHSQGMAPLSVQLS